MDLAGRDEPFMIAVMSDGTARFWGAGFLVSDFKPVSAAEDEPCVRAMDSRGNRVAISHTDSITLIQGDEPFFSFAEWPHTLQLADGHTPVRVRADRDFVALDESGAVWALWKRSTMFGTEASKEFELVPLPVPAADITADLGFCALLVTGEVYCVDYVADGWGRFGMGFDVVLEEPTRLPIEGAVEFVLAHAGACWLDDAGSAYCAGSSSITGYPDSMFENYRRPYFDVVPGLPALVKLEMASGSACGFTAEGELWCWGLHAKSNPPLHMGTFPGWKDIALADQGMCVLDAQDRVFCLNANSYGDVNCSEKPDKLGVWHRIAIPDCGDP